MILTSSQIASRGIVRNAAASGKRESTYDATVGEIIEDGIPIVLDEYTLRKRGMVWVVSREEFTMPNDITGLATLRTTWTHDGVLALNVGIVDPGWSGPLAAALVNFSDRDFVVRKGEPFFRVAFFEHPTTNSPLIAVNRDDYIRKIRDKSVRSPTTFLNLSALAGEVLDQIFTFPRWVNRIAILGIFVALASVIIALVAIFVPIAYGISTEWVNRTNEVETLRRNVDRLSREQEAISSRLQRAVETRRETPPPTQRTPDDAN